MAVLPKRASPTRDAGKEKGAAGAAPLNCFAIGEDQNSYLRPMTMAQRDEVSTFGMPDEAEPALELKLE